MNSSFLENKISVVNSPIKLIDVQINTKQGE